MCCVWILQALYEMLGPEANEANVQSAEEGSGDHAKKVQFIFERIDKDHDGRVTLDEFMTICTGS